MATWAKIKIFYDNMLESEGATLAATSTESTGDFSVNYLAAMLETKMWKAEDNGMAAIQYITLDLVSTTKDADYIILHGHNLNTAGATVVLQYSTDNFAADINDAYTPEAPSNDNIYFKSFAAPGVKRYWRLKISGLTATAPYIKIASWGLETELTYAARGYDPYRQKIKGSVLRTNGGQVAAMHTFYRDRILKIPLDDIDTAEYAKFKAWLESTWKQFFIAWEQANNPDDLWLVYSDINSDFPLKENGVFRSGSLNLMGRKVT